VARQCGRQLKRLAVGKEEALPDLERRVVVRHADRAQALGFMRWKSGHGEKPQPILPTLEMGGGRDGQATRVPPVVTARWPAPTSRVRPSHLWG
jgi:hypothetical protein